MGWSQSDLARRLHIESQNIFNWESGNSMPDPKICEELSLLFRQAEVTALDMLSQVQAEVIMDQKALESVDTRELSELEFVETKAAN